MIDVAHNINNLRIWMDKENIDVFIIPHQDEYLSEYLPPQNERLHWATAFTGSAGMAIVGKDKAAIFVDGRYTVQVQEQVDKNIFEILHLVDNPYMDWIIDNFSKDAKIGYDSKLNTPIWFDHVSKKLTGYNLISLDKNPIDILWDNRPSSEINKALLLSEEYSGESSNSKRKRIAEEIKSSGNDSAFLSKLDSIMWLLNIRGNDVPCNPVLLCSGIIHADSSFDLYIDLNKIPIGFDDHVGPNVRVHDLDSFSDIKNNNANKRIMFDANSSNLWSYNIFHAGGYEIVKAQDVCSLPKACKNDIEISGMKNCHIRDGVAVSRFLFWIEQQVESGHLLDEEQLASKLDSLRTELDLFKGPSFGTISAAGSNAAMCHYSHKNSKVPGKLEMGSVYLVDSGGQYLDGTTDITRTVAIGEVSDEIKRSFTLVLKGHISLGSAIFPKGTSGHQLDSLARQYLWEYGLDYDHGTGHGVGHFLNVHEGPQGVGKGGSNVPLEKGMVISNEPGYYLENGYGIRCENLVFVKKDETKSGSFLKFEDLTMTPFDKRLFDMDLLTESDINWINDYHAKVYEHVSKGLNNQEELDWLKEATAPIN